MVTMAPRDRLVQRTTLVLAALLAVSLMVGSWHHHDVGHAHPCTACALGQSSVIETDLAVPAVAPAESEQALHVTATRPVCPARLATASCRAPPRT